MDCPPWRTAMALVTRVAARINTKDLSMHHHIHIAWIDAAGSTPFGRLVKYIEEVGQDVLETVLFCRVQAQLGNPVRDTRTPSIMVNILEGAWWTWENPSNDTRTIFTTTNPTLSLRPCFLSPGGLPCPPSGSS